MSFNMPITVIGDVSADCIETATPQTPLKLGSVLDLAQIMIALNEDDDMSAICCRHCGEDLNEDEPTETLEGGDAECEANYYDPHEKQYAPFTWAKNIAVSFDEERDEIELAIATGDPRVGWTFKLRRDPATGAVYMHLPHADMDSPHEPIKELHPGTFAIG